MRRGYRSRAGAYRKVSSWCSGCSPLGVGRWALGVGRWALGVGRWALGFSAEHAEPSTLNAQLYYPPNPEPSTILNLPCIITPARPALLSCPASLNLLCVKESHVCCNHAPHRHPQKPACHVAG